MSQRARILVMKELGDFLSDIRLSVPAGFMSLMLPIITLAGVRLLGYFAARAEAGVEESFIKVYLVTLVFVASFPLSLTIPVTLESFVGERERRTIESLLLAPFRSREFYTAKITASFIPPLVLGSFSLTLYSVLSYFFLPFYPPPRIFVTLLLLIAIKALLFVTTASVISSQSRTVRAANMASSLVILPATALIAFESFCLFRLKYDLLYWTMVVLAFYALLYLRLGIKLFNREWLILYADPLEELRRVGRAFTQPVRSLRENFPWREMLILSLFFALGFVFGYGRILEEIASGRFAQTFSVVGTGQSGLTGTAQLNAALGIFAHNLQALAFLILLAPFTLGAIAGLFVLLPGVIIGTAAGAASASTGSANAVTGLVFLYVEIPAAIAVASYALRVGLSFFHRAEDPFDWIEGVARSVAGLVYAALIALPLFMIASLLEAGILR